MAQAVGSISNFRVIGGTMNFSALTRKLLKDDAAEYKVGKAYAWLRLIKDGMKPTKWYEPTKNGTKVKFEFISDKSTYLMAMGEFRGYLDVLNQEFPGLGIRLESEDGE